MTLKKPESMDDCLYFSNRDIGQGRAMAWVLRPDCTSCGKGKMGKPIKDNGKVDKKADYYECPSCKHQLSEDEISEDIQLSVDYVCPYCKHEGETTTEYKRKSFKGVKAFVFVCEKCSKKIPISKKLKDVESLL